MPAPAPAERCEDEERSIDGAGAKGAVRFVGGGVSALVAEEVTAVLEVVDVDVGCSRVMHFAGV